MTRRVTALRDTSDGTLPAYAWPGGYQLTYTTRDGLEVCPACANNDADDAVTDYDVFWEGPPKTCDDCGALVYASYGDPDCPDPAHDSLHCPTCEEPVPATS